MSDKTWVEVTYAVDRGGYYNDGFWADSNTVQQVVSVAANHATVLEQQRIINLFEDNHYKNTWEHYPTKWVYMENCTACNAIAFIKEQNK